MNEKEVLNKITVDIYNSMTPRQQIRMHLEDLAYTLLGILVIGGVILMLVGGLHYIDRQVNKEKLCNVYWANCK